MYRSVAGLVVFGACSASTEAAPPSAVDAAAAEPPPVAVDGGMAPLAGAWAEQLALPAGGMAWVTPPVGATEPRPVIIAVHGAIDDPGQHCSTWRIIADAYAFVVCPAGRKVRTGTYVWSSSSAIDEAVDAALVAVKERYGPYVADGPSIYVAFSQGANLAGPVITRKTGTPRFARTVLVEGGYRALETAQAARAFHAAGGERVLFACSQPGCATGFAIPASALDRQGIPARVLYPGSYGHAIPPAVRAAINEALPWLVDGLPAWRSYAAHPKLPSH